MKIGDTVFLVDVNIRLFSGLKNAELVVTDIVKNRFIICSLKRDLQIYKTADMIVCKTKNLRDARGNKIDALPATTKL